MHQLLLTADETAQVLRMHERTVKRLAADGEIPGARRVGREWRFVRTELEKYLGAIIPPDDTNDAVK